MSGRGETERRSDRRLSDRLASSDPQTGTAALDQAEAIGLQRSAHTIRDDEQYVVLVGWDRELRTFYAYVFDRVGMDGKPVLAVGHTPHEIPTISHLESQIGAFARLNASVISALRHEAPPLTLGDNEHSASDSE